MTVLLALSGVAYAAGPRAHPGRGPRRDPPAEPKAALKAYPARYYVIHSDLPVEVVREAAVRLNVMAESYHQRTKDFGGTIRSKLSFYLFADRADYIAAGGPPGSAGVYMRGRSRRLMTFAQGGRVRWHAVQHEGFHQFADMVIGGDLPIWVNEGLAEYFGTGIFTGDNLVVGVIEPDRLARLRRGIRAGRTVPILQMMQMTHARWNAELSARNYDQAWSMIHFLVHGDDGKYAEAIARVVADIADGAAYETAWGKHFGMNLAAFEQRWRQWWLAQGADPTADLRARATVETLTSFLARYGLQGHTFKNVGEFVRLARTTPLAMDPNTWLPRSLLARALDDGRRLGVWTLRTDPGRLPRLVCTQRDGTTLTGWYGLTGRQVARVVVERTAPPKKALPPKSAPGPTRTATNRGVPRQ